MELLFRTPANCVWHIGAFNLILCMLEDCAVLQAYETLP